MYTVLRAEEMTLFYEPLQMLFSTGVFKSWASGLSGDYIFNLLAPELFFLILAHPVYKM